MTTEQQTKREGNRPRREEIRRKLLILTVVVASAVPLVTLAAKGHSAAPLSVRQAARLVSNQVRGEVESGDAVFGISKNGHGVRGIGQGFEGACGVFGSSAEGPGVQGVSTSNYGVVGKTSNKGVSGVYGVNDTGGPGVKGDSNTGTGVSGNGRFGVYAEGSRVGIEINGKSVADLIVGEVEFNRGTQLTSVFRVDHSGRGFFNGGTQQNGADVAEIVTSSNIVHPGDVVEIDPDHPGQFRIAATPNSSAVAGVISTSPGVTLNARNTADSPANTEPQLALAGRVPVKVSAENGSIRPGDLLVASSTPGHAMRAPANPVPGTVIGKALGRLEKGAGRMDLLVMLR